MTIIEELVKEKLKVPVDERSQKLYHDNYQTILILFNERNKGKTYTLNYAIDGLTALLIIYCGYTLKTTGNLPRSDI